MKFLAFDAVLMRPGCVILQALLHGDSALAGRFPAESWLVEITPNLKTYSITDEQANLLVDRVRGQYKAKGEKQHA